jgi:hypothetical protein
MDNAYQELMSFKYEANLLYTESFLAEHHIPFESQHEAPFQLLVKPEDYNKASTLVKSLDLDESLVDEESDGYIDGYQEWADKRYVTGYFTGGVIPRWMFEKKYAVWFGPVNIITGLFMLYTLSDIEFSLGLLVPLLLYSAYLFCGVLMTIRGFKK